MAANTHLLRSLCHDQEMFDQAQIFLHLAQKKTAPGSGFELRSHTTGLPAICAYMASQKLQNTTVSRKSAQAASCLKASDFDKALQIVQAAIGGSRRQIGVKEVYDSLVREYELSSDRTLLLNWLSAAEKTLPQSESRLNPDDPTVGPSVKYAAFYWIYNAYTGKNLATQQEYAEDHSIPLKSFSKLLKQVSTVYAPLKSQIQKEALAQKISPTKTPATTPRRSPKKPALRALPSKDSPSKHKTVEGPPSKRRTVQDSPLKRKAAPAQSDDADQAGSDLDMLDTLTHQTPTKKPRLGPSPKAKATPVKPLVFPPVASSSSSSRLTLDDTPPNEAQEAAKIKTKPKVVTYATRTRIIADSMDADDDPAPAAHYRDADVDVADDDEEDEDERPPRRRFRPVFLDHKQWYSTDRRLKRIWRDAEQYKQNMLQLRT